MTQSILNRPRHQPGPGRRDGEPENVARLLSSCVDRPGIVSAVTAFLHLCAVKSSG